MHVSLPKRIKHYGQKLDFWYVRVTGEGGKRSWRTTGTADYQEALKARDRILKDVASEQERITARPLSLCVETWLESKKVRVSANYLRVVKLYSGAFMKAWGPETGVAKINLHDVETFLAARITKKQNSYQTVNYIRIHLISFFGFCMDREWVATNPAKKTKAFRTEKKTPRLVPIAEVDRLLETVKDRDPASYDLVFMASRTGLRKGSLLKLDWAWIDLDQKRINFPARAMKSRREFRCPILNEVADMLKQRKEELGNPPDGLVFHEIPSSWWRSLCVAAGSPDLRFHDLRRSFLQRCRKMKVPFEHAMALGDWTSAKIVLESYSSISDEEMRESLDQAFRNGSNLPGNGEQKEVG